MQQLYALLVIRVIGGCNMWFNVAFPTLSTCSKLMGTEFFGPAAAFAGAESLEASTARAHTLTSGLTYLQVHVTPWALSSRSPHSNLHAASTTEIHCLDRRAGMSQRTWG